MTDVLHAIDGISEEELSVIGARVGHVVLGELSSRASWTVAQIASGCTESPRGLCAAVLAGLALGYAIAQHEDVTQ